MTIQKKIYFKDTLPVLNCKHSALIERFELKDVKRELFLYKYYTFDRLDSNKGTIDEVGVDEDRKWTKEDYNHSMKTLIRSLTVESMRIISTCINTLNSTAYMMFMYSDNHSINSKRLLQRVPNQCLKRSHELQTKYSVACL